jgi:FSR family fosmidomycin resistance protein-like MFS transporter
VAITSSLTQKRRALLVTIFASGGYLGFALSQLIFSKIYFGLNGNTAIMIVPTIVLMILVAAIGFHGKGSLQAPPGRRYGWSAFKKLFKCKDLVTLYGMQVCNQAVYWAIVFLLPDILSERGYDPWISFGGGHMCFILGAFFSIIPGGYFADVYSPKKVVFCSTITGACLLYLFLITHPGPLLLLLLLLIMGALLGISNPVAVAMGNHILPSRPGLVSAFLMGLVWCLSESIGPGGGGLMTKFFETEAAAKSLAVLGILFFVGLIFTARLPLSVDQEFDIDKD